MVWYDLNIGKFKAKITPLDVAEKDAVYCDADGNTLKKVGGTFNKGYFLNEKDDTQHDKAFRLINGKAQAEFKSRLKEVPKYLEVGKDEAEDLLTEKYYLVECDELYNELIKSGKAFKFGYNGGRGYKAYRTYLLPSPLFKGFLEMRCGRGQKTELIKGILADLEETKELKAKLTDINLTIQKVNRVAVEDMITI